MKKKNMFKVIDKKDDKIILQEEENKSRLWLFWLRHKKSITISLSTFLICILLVIIGLSVSLFRGSNDYDITYIIGDDEVVVNPDPGIDDEDIMDELLGEIARSEGVVLLTETVMSSHGDVIYYFTDNSAIVVRSNGKIYRVSSDKNGHYGINKSGKIDDTATKILVNSTTSTLSDGTVVTMYSDGTAKVELKGNAIFVRDSNNIELLDGNNFNRTLPSGVALSENISRVNGTYINVFTDNSAYVSVGDDKYVVNKNTKPNIDGSNANYDRNNSFVSISEKKYGEYTINHYLNGSATVTDKDGNVFYVRKSGDLVLKDKKFYEILPNKGKANSRGNYNCPNRDVVTYFDNGVAIVINNDGSRQYVEDADEIIYNGNKNITSSYTSSPLISERITVGGEKAYNFENGKSQVMNKNGSSYIVDTDTLEFKPIEDEKPPEEPDEDDKTETPEIVNPGEGIYISEAENIYNEFKNVENTTFIIKNNNTKSKTLRIAIEEVSDYTKYNTTRLDPKYVKFQATIGDSYVPGTVLSANPFEDSDGVTNYIIYDGVIGAKQTVNVTLALYVDYSLLDNSHQNKGFVGTLKVYVDA